MARTASLLARAVSTKETVRRATQHAEDARRAYRAACLRAVQGGVTIAVLAAAVGTSWSRMSKDLDRAASEARRVERQ